MPEVPKPFDAALDLFVYAPVGLALTAAEELPKLAAKGRTRVNTQLTMARVVGQFALTKGRQELEKRLGSQPAGTPRPYAAAPPTPADSGDSVGQGPAAGGPVTNGSGPVRPFSAPADGPFSAPVSAPAGGSSDGSSGPQAVSLAIPGYDSLSASQVVQRLAGLSRQERAEVAAYEQAHRGRRTILNRIDQLQAQ